MMYAVLVAAILGSCSAFFVTPNTNTFRGLSSLKMGDLTDTMRFKTVFRLNFKTLYSAIVACGLEDTLKGPGPFTSTF